MALFTEAAYMFAAIHELYASKLLPGGMVPHFPSQWDEGIGSEPFDARVTTFCGDAFLQFKRSKLRVKPRKTETHGFLPKYYQIDLYKKNNYAQHNALVIFANKEPETYYVAPQFNYRDELHRFFKDGEVCDYSVSVPVREIGRIMDRAVHRIYFNRSTARPKFCSEPRLVEGATTLSQVLIKYGDSAANRNLNLRTREVHRTLVRVLRDTRLAIRRGEGREVMSLQRLERDQRIETVSRVLRYTLDVEWVVLSREQFASDT